LSLGRLKAKKKLPLCMVLIGGGQILFNIWALTNGFFFMYDLTDTVYL